MRKCRCGHPMKAHRHYRAGTGCLQCGCPWFLWEWNPFLVRAWAQCWLPAEITHMCPLVGHGYTPCCGKTPFELPRGDRLTNDADLVTCPEVTVSRSGDGEVPPADGPGVQS